MIFLKMPLRLFYISVCLQALPLLALYQYVASKVCRHPRLTAGCRILKVCKKGHPYTTLVASEGAKLFLSFFLSKD